MTAAKRTAPISSHPIFKWAVGLWFALLMGLGLFVMPAEVHRLIGDRIGLAGAIDDPLLLRAALALGAALLGLALGLVLALRVIALNDAADADASEDESEDTAPAKPVTAAAADDEDDLAIWLRDAESARPAPAKDERKRPLRVRSSAEAEREDHGPRVDDAPRRPFNPREDLAEEGIAPDESEDDQAIALFEGEAVVEGNANPPILATAETVVDDAYLDDSYFDNGWDDASTSAEDQPAPALPEPDTAAQPVAAGPGADDLVDDAAPVLATGDLSLSELTERLRRALEAAKAAPPPSDGGIESPDDPTIAFLRREAERLPQDGGETPPARDPQAELRSALDKLSRVGQAK